MWKSGDQLVKKQEGLVPDEGTFAADSQTATLQITFPTTCETFTCEVTSSNYPKEAERFKRVNIFVYKVEVAEAEVRAGTPTNISCLISHVHSKGVTVLWREGNIPVTQEVETSSVKDGQQISTLKIENPKSDMIYTCLLTSIRYPASTAYLKKVNLGVYQIKTESYDVLSGTVSTLTCLIEGVTATKVDILWLNSRGHIFYEETNDDNIFVTDGELAEGTKESTLTVSANITLLGDQIFTCRIKVGENKKPDDTPVLLKTFTVRTTNDFVRTGEPAEIKCNVISPTDTLMVSWTNQIHILEDTKIYTVPDNITSINLTVKSLFEDVSYTCNVKGKTEYNFISQIEVNDLSLSSGNEVRAFTGSTITLSCNHTLELISEGSYFSWKYKDQTCQAQICKNVTDNPKTSEIRIKVAGKTSGAWRCFYSEQKSGRILKSKQVDVIEVQVSGTQQPTRVLGLAGAESVVTCSVPYNLTLSRLINLEWMLDGRVVSSKGVGYTKQLKVVLFSLAEKVYSTTEVTWGITLTHSTIAVGTLNCQAHYNTGQGIETPVSYLNEIRISSDTEYVIVTPEMGAIVTFVTYSHSVPLSYTFNTPQVNISLSTKIEDRIEGVVVTEVYKISSPESLIKAARKEDLSVKESVLKYSVQIDNSTEVFLSIPVAIVGETFTTSPVWAVEGKQAILTTFLTATNKSTIEVIWQHRIEGNWTNVPSDGYLTLYYSVAENGVMSTSLVIQRVKEPDVTQHRAVILIDNKQQTSDMITVKLVNATITKLKPVFEMLPMIFSVTIFGETKPISAFLCHKESGKNIVIDLNHVTETPPFFISHRLETVIFSDGGFYTFKVNFESGLRFITAPILLKVKLRCRPLTAPPNTVLSTVDIPESGDYKVVVTCAKDSLVMMNEDATEVICDTSVGLYTRKILLSPCLRVIDQI